MVITAYKTRYKLKLTSEFINEKFGADSSDFIFICNCTYGIYYFIFNYKQ
ncbi:hypothetical protein XIS1_890031 [Xenorhabdus innexi]|uniref:Uncharacterized protein n=1 Tax=Xenorhabdus innexi TaxID=290109 RepID=A0A1N6N191_9GAMM|nr:hypothetical protein XIS1_890031 [Xenorhabdus innexi]